MIISLGDYKTLLISGNKIQFKERIRQFEEFGDKVAVRINAKKGDPEFGNSLEEGNVYIVNKDGVLWIYQSKNWISNIWKKEDKILGMYDGSSDIWVDIDKLEIVKMIWNPYGLDNPDNVKMPS